MGRRSYVCVFITVDFKIIFNCQYLSAKPNAYSIHSCPITGFGTDVFFIGASNNFNNRYWDNQRHVLGHDEVKMRKIVPRKVCLELPTEHVHSFSAQSQHLCDALFWRRIWRGPRDGAPSPTRLQAVSSWVKQWSQ